MFVLFAPLEIRFWRIEEKQFPIFTFTDASFILINCIAKILYLS